jgi:hypothetical protein
MSIQSNFPNLQPSLLLDFANTKQLDNRVTFTRSTPAVYYDGKTTAMAEQNLFTYSQELDNAAWIKSAATITANTTASPDGTSTADTFTPASTSPLAYQTCPSAGTFTFSVYAKALVDTNVTLACTTNYEGVAAQFNLSAGTAGSVTTYSGGSNATITGGTSSIVSVGNGWYRCILAGVTVTQARAFHFGSGGTNGTFTGTIYVWGAQLEQRSSATAYTVTTTQPITNYIPVLLSAGGNQARFDCNPTTGESLGLLIEEQRTNLALQSADFSTTWSSANQVSITSNTIVAPDGTLTGDKLIADATSNVHFVVQNTGSISAPWTFSCYAKAGEYSRVGFSYSNTGYVFFNLTTGVQEGTVGGGITSTSITSVGNGWYRISFTSTSTASGGNIGIYLFNTTYTSGIPTFTGNGFSGAYIWGAQAEAASFATSYIATTSASATRTADVASMTGVNFSSWFNNAEGTLYAEASPQTQSTNSFGIASLTNLGGSANSISMYYTGGNVVDVESLVNNSVQYTYLISRGSQPTKVTHGYKVNDSNVALNGTAYTTDTVCNVPQLTALTIGTIYDTGGFPCNGTIRKIAYYPLRVTNAQLAALTS